MARRSCGRRRNYYALIIERALRKAAGVPVEVRRARTGDEALDLLRDFVPDLLILDLKMPGMGGHEALEAIKGDDVLRSVPVAIFPRPTATTIWPRATDSGVITSSPSRALHSSSRRSLVAFSGTLRSWGGIRRGSTGASTTAVSAVDPTSIATLKTLRWVVVGVLIALYFLGRVLGAF